MLGLRCAIYPYGGAMNCLWTRADDDTDLWETSCGEEFCIIEGTPKENKMRFCCYCGKPLEEIEETP